MNNEDTAHKSRVMFEVGTPEQQEQAERWLRGQDPIPNKMNVEYIDHMGSDSRVVDAARVSFNKRKGNSKLDRQDIKLIEYLAKHNHFTPFTHPTITLVYKVPIFVARQEFKHIVGFTRNEVSRRYVDDTPELFSPNSWRERPDKSIKQGSGGELCELATADVDAEFIRLMDIAQKGYIKLLSRGVAPEQARMVLPQSMITEYMITGSLYAFTRMFNLRNDPHAQAEIRELALLVESRIQPLFPESWRALTNV